MGNIPKQNSNLPDLIISRNQVLVEITVPANGYVDIEYTPAPVSGYTHFLYLPVAAGHASAGIMAVTGALVRLRNFSSANINASPTIMVVYKKSK